MSAVGCVLAMLLSMGAAAAPPVAWEPSPESHTPDPCLNPAVEPLCAPTPPAGSSACKAIALVIRPLGVQQSTAANSATWPVDAPTSEEHLVDLPILGSSVRALDATCDSKAATELEACGRADVADLDLDLNPLLIPLVLRTDAVTEEGCSTGGSGFNTAGISELYVQHPFGPPLAIPVGVGHTFVPLGPLGFVSLNEQYDQPGDCQRNTGSAVHIRLVVPAVEVYVSWVSTVACRYPTTVTTASDPAGGPFAAPATARDQATLASGGPAVTGDLEFFLCKPSEVVAGAGCPAGGASVGGVVPAAGAVTSPSTTTANFPGGYCWRAEYAGDAFHLPATHTNDGSECFQLKVVPTITTTSNPTGSTYPTVTATDTATVGGPAGAPTPTGVINFVLCRPSEVTPTGCLAPSGIASGAPVLAGGSATSTPLGGASTSAVGKYCWRVNYLGDANYFGAEHTNAGSECFTTVKQTPTLSTTSNPTGITGLNQQARDTATLGGPAGVPTPTGTVRFFLCNPTTGTLVVGSGCTAGGVDLGTAAVSGGTATSALTGTNTAPGVHCWRAEYGGDAVYAAATHTNYGSECWTQKRAPSLQTAARWQDPAFASRTYDRAWVNATGGGPLPTGTVTFYLCGPFTTATACTSGGAFNGTRTLPGSAPNQVDSDKILGPFIHQRWYCYRAEYSGDASYLAATHTNTTTECFQHVEPQ